MNSPRQRKRVIIEIGFDGTQRFNRNQPQQGFRVQLDVDNERYFQFLPVAVVHAMRVYIFLRAPCHHCVRGLVILRNEGL